MSDYKETTLSGTTWQRCQQIVIDNPFKGTPSVRFDEEEVLALDGGREIKRAVGAMAVPFDPAKTFALRNPLTGAVIEGATSSYGDAYVLLYSAYLAAALERDTPAASNPLNPV